MSTETTKKKIKIDNGTNFARAYTDKAIDAKLPTDLKATAANLSLLAGSAKIGSGINLSGFEYDEETKTLKASGGSGASVSPCLNLLDTETEGIRTSITEEEKNNLDKGLYNSVLYFDESAGPLGFISTFFPEPLADTDFSIFNLTADEATQKITITGSSIYHIEVFDKNEDGTYPISIQKMEELEATFGGGGGGAIQEIEAIKSTDEPIELAASRNGYEPYTHYTLSSTPTSPMYMMKVKNDDGSYSRITMILQYLDTPEQEYYGPEQGYYGCKVESVSPDVITCVYAYSSGTNAILSNQCYLPPEIKSSDVGKVLVASGDGYMLENLSTMAEKTVCIVKAHGVKNIPFIQKYHGIYGCYRIDDGSITVSGERSRDVIFVGYPFVYGDANEGNGYLMGSIYMGTFMPRSVNNNCYYSLVGTGVYEFSNGKINITPKGCVGNMTLSGLALLAGHETTSDEITTAIENGNNQAVSYDVNLMSLQYGFKETADGSAVTKTFLGYADHKTSNKLTLSGLFDGKQGTAVLEKDDSGNWVSNTPIEYAGAQETHTHTLIIKENGRIVFAANRELRSAKAATSVKTLISTFAGTTTAGFGDYILLTVDTEAKLKKQDGTEVGLTTLTAQILDFVK